ncbi:PAS domain-containing sensor histidine kinase [Clostridium saudiense]|uniref:PAS domain-containing sensor histidine kinase n=1 Tax=Clostridium saudiense TaxID=1414720 RepID=UPI0018AB0453|nr:HAMP domain-containing sensor histidine kinase [Clostridium saudiense]
MREKINENYKCKINISKLLVESVIAMAIIIAVFCLTTLFNNDINSEYVDSVVMFIRVINSSMAIIAIVICLILYNETNEQVIFSLLLVYTSIAVTVVIGQVDYLTFFNFEFVISNYICMTSAALRMVILFSTIIPNSKINKFINKYKKISFVFTIVYSIICWEIEKKFFVGAFFISKRTLIAYRILMFILSSIVGVKLLITSIKKRSVILRCFSISIFIFSIKTVYISNTFSYNNFSIKLISAFLTYMVFLIIIIGCVVEFNLLYVKSNVLNKELRKFYNLAHFNSHTYIFICDKDLNISYMNNKTKNYFKCDISSKELKDKLLKIKDVMDNIDDIIKTLERDGVWRGILRSNENKSIVDCFIQSIYLDESAGTEEILVSYVDITDRINLEAELNSHKINDIKKSEFISTLSHELKTPLNIFYSTIQLLEEIKSVNEEEFSKVYDKYSNTLKINSKRMLRLVNNIVDTTRIDSGAFNAEFGNYEIISLVEDIVLSTVSFAEYKNIKVEFDTNVEEHYIKCDPNMIEKIVLNLVSNSIKYTNCGGYIKIQVIVEDKWVKILFKDNGIGIPLEMKKKIFDRFLRLDNSLRRLNEGSGIGLSIVKSMIEVHKGSISVNSILNKGSVFKVRLPNVLLENAPMNIYEFNEMNTELELLDIYI